MFIKRFFALVGIGSFFVLALILLVTPKNTLHVSAEVLLIVIFALLALHFWMALLKASNQEKVWKQQAERNARVQQINDNLVGSIVFQVTTDSNGDNPAFTHISRGCQQLLDLTPEQITHHPDSLFHRIDPNDLKSLEKTMKQSVKTHAPIEGELRISRNDRPDAYVIVKALPQIINAQAIAWDGVAFDITKQKDAEKALMESEERYEQLVRQSKTFTWEIDKHGRYTYLSPLAEDIIGYPPEEIVGKRLFYELAPEEHRQMVKTRGTQFIAAEKEFTGYENPILTKTGETIWVATNGAPLRDKNGHMIGLRGYDTDITSLKMAESEMKRLAACVEQATESIVITNRNGRIEYVNPAFTSTTGYTYAEVVGKSPRILKSGMHDQTLYQEMWKTLDMGKVWRGRLVNKKKDGTIYTQETSISPIRDENGNVVCYVAVTHDISETLSLQEQLLQSQKMESIGRLAGGIAHDFNNMLMGIMGYTEMASEKIPDNHPARKDLDAVMHTSKRTAILTRQLLTFARKESIKPVVLDLNASVPNTLGLLKRLIGESIQLKWEPGEITGRVKMDPGQIDQILANLCVNAKDALQDKNNGVITIRTGNTHISITDTTDYPDAEPGDYIFCSVQDNGCGIPEAIQENIFDPFFTTKGVGEGTGLGLSTVYGILKQNKGFISVKSELNLGTNITLYFPKVIESLVQAASNRQSPSIGKKGLTVLLVEDDPGIRAVTARFLQNMKIHVLVADDPRKAIEMAKQHEGTIDIILTDMVMPGMNGKSMAKVILEKNSNTKVIYMSGYTSDLATEQQRNHDGSLFLAKPFSREQLTEAITKTLETSNA
jgi:PAS domain S-box-containing protein